MKDLNLTPTQAPLRIDLFVYLNVLRRYTLAICLWIVLVVLITALVTLQLTPQYLASATLLIEAQANKAVSIEEVYTLDTSKKEYYQTQFEILRSDHIAEKVISQLEVEQLNEFRGDLQQTSIRNTLLGFIHQWGFFSPYFSKPKLPSNDPNSIATQQAILKSFKSHLTIEPIRNTQLVKIHFKSKDPHLASQVANAIGHAYMESNLEARLLATQTASSWISDRLIELKEKLNKSEVALIHFLKTEGLIELEDIDELAGKELTHLTIRLSEARDRRVEAESLFSLLRSSWEGKSTLLSVPEISNHPQVRDVKNAEIDAERKVSELAKRYGPKHDKMIQAIAQRDAVNARTDTVINNLARGIKKELDSAQQQENALINEFDKKKQEYQNIISKRAQYEAHKRDVESSRQLYDMFLNRQKETSVASDFEAVNARFTDLAHPPAHPFFPQTTKLIFISGASAFLFGIACAFLADAYRNTIEKPDDIEEKFALQHLGYIPQIKTRAFKNDPIDHTYYFDSNSFIFSESIRTIRTAILLSLQNKQRKILAITSSMPSEGKTTLALSLAQSLAKMERTLLIDCDLRIPAIGQRCGLPRNPSGLTNILMTDSLIKDNIYHDAVSSLDILPAGLLPNQPQELLSSSKFASLIDELKEKYDRIIIDTPPILVVSDSLIIGALAEGIILLVKAESTTEEKIKKSIKQLTFHRIPIDGVVLNQMSLKHTDKKYTLHQGYYKHKQEDDERLEAS